jgi:uncharacterized membrane protein
MDIIMITLWLHTFSTIIVLGGYIFLAIFWWPIIKRLDDTRIQLHLLGQTMRRFFPTVLVGLTIQITTGGLYLLPPIYRAFGAGDETALAHFHLLLIYKLAAVFFVMLLVPMQLFGMGFRITRMDAGIYPFDAELFHRIAQRMQIVSYVIILLLAFVVIVSSVF